MGYIDDKKKAMNLILDAMDTLKSPSNRKLYEEKFKNMSDKDFISFCKNGGPVRFFIEAFDNEVNYNDVLKLCDKLGVPLMEYVTIPHIFAEDGDELISEKKVMVGPVTFKVLQQMATKESASTSDVKQKDKFGQVKGEDKAASMSDQDVVSLVAQGYDQVPTELLTFRADNEQGFEDAMSEILTTGKCSMPISIKDPKNKKSQQMLDVYYRIAGLETNLVRDLEK